MATDCYLVLGVPRDASITRIRRAFRRFCHETHADALDPERFNAVRDAYETLRDRTRRFLHDLELHHAAEAAAAAPPPSMTVGPVDLMDSFETHLPSRERILQHIAGNFTDRHAPKAHPARELLVELAIDSVAAARGGRVPVDVPVAERCARCGGNGSTGFMTCPDCGGHGLLWDLARVDVLLAPPVRDGTMVPVSLRHLGMHNLLLRVHIRVAA